MGADDIQLCFRTCARLHTPYNEVNMKLHCYNTMIVSASREVPTFQF
jgi:hypothetical protein